MAEQGARTTPAESVFNQMDKAAFSLGIAFDHAEPAAAILEKLAESEEDSVDLAMVSEMAEEALDYISRAEFILMTITRSIAREIGMEGVYLTANQSERLNFYMRVMESSASGKRAKAKAAKAKKKGFTPEAA